MSTGVDHPADPAAEPRVDGRTARGQRTQAAIVDALLALVEEQVELTAPRIAERAGVSVRSIYQHFADLEALFAHASNRQVERILEMARPLPTAGPLDQRLDALVAQRGRILEAITPVARASRRQEPVSPTLRETRRGLEDMGRAELAAVFAPELADRTPAERDALLDRLETAASWPVWEFLRDRGHGVDAAAAVVRDLLAAQLAAAR